MVKKSVLAIALVAVLPGCSQLEAVSESAREYKIEKEGVAQENDRRDFDYDGTSMFNRVQKYKISVLGDDKNEHFLVAHVVRKVGKKVESDNKSEFIFIADGSAIYECRSFYMNVKTKEVDGADDPVCEISPRSYLEFSGIAKASKE